MISSMRKSVKRLFSEEMVARVNTQGGMEGSNGIVTKIVN